MCNCSEQPTLMDISDCYSDFKSKLNQLDVGNWVFLKQCLGCCQYYKVDEWDKYQPYYAVKIPSQDNWESFDSKSLIKEQMVLNRGGLTNDPCIWAGCNIQQVKGNAYCVEHLYSTGAQHSKHLTSKGSIARPRSLCSVAALGVKHQGRLWSS